MRLKVYCVGLFFCVFYLVKADSNINLLMPQKQNDTLTNKQKQNIAYAAGIGGTAFVHAGLYKLWYSGYPQSKFHFFNDNQEWLQMDKFGHCFSSYYLGLAGIEAAKWAGVPKNKQWKWALFGSIFQDPIEIWDGFSSAWGASFGDLAANSFGTLLGAGQEAIWHEQKVRMKFSYTSSNYAAIRPNTLGGNFNERFLKDYNAQTYWLCYSPLKNRAQWLGLGLGYGANGMLGGNDNIWIDKNMLVQDYSNVKRYRQYYLSFDFNLNKIKTRRKGLKTLFFVLNCIKLPAPALEFSQGKITGHWLKF
jgi:uncharacterized protein YfiM (DUF2279 family)